jgi:hypothetical protein
MNIRWMAAMAVTAGSLLLASCGGGGGIGGTGSPTGTMHLSITDAPSCGYDEVNVTIERVRVHQSSSAVDADSGWSEVVLRPAKRVDLLSLTNGVLEELGQTALPAGKYTQMRLVLASNPGSKPFANSVVPTGGAETALTTPSGQQTGLKLNVDIDIEADQVADFVIDFDACKSVVKRGNSGEYNLKPVVAVFPGSDVGLRVVGFVHPSIATTSTKVSVQSGGVPLKATTPDATGRFVLYPVRPGNYDLVVTSAGRVTAVMTGVPVITTAFTHVNSAAVPIAPATTTVRTVMGKVTPATATVRALQTFDGGPTVPDGPTVEVAWGSVDSDTGAFEFTLPIQAPVKTAYVANPMSLSFAADATAGKYTLEAASDGAKTTQAIDATAVVPSVTFTFP